MEKMETEAGNGQLKMEVQEKNLKQRIKLSPTEMREDEPDINELLMISENYKEKRKNITSCIMG